MTGEVDFFPESSDEADAETHRGSEKAGKHGCLPSD